jgi:predicted nucleic acid-binding protein
MKPRKQFAKSSINSARARGFLVSGLEIGNILEVGVRGGRHDTGFRDSTLADLALLPIQTDSETDRHAWGATARLAARHRLTLNDAAYLELALRRELPLAHTRSRLAHRSKG